VVLVIDTSSPWSALAVADPDSPSAEDVVLGGREDDLPARVLTLAEPANLTRVAVCLGPGSFTGLRVGVSYGLGLAMGLGVPLLGFGSLELQATRADTRVTALVEAGRGRLYWLSPGGEPRLGEPSDLPLGLPAAGWLRPATAQAVTSAGVHLLGDRELAGFAVAAARLLASGAAEKVGYDTVKLRYMHSFVPGG
jgi:tRNA threonylcarbamoyl adenosine modification protein YeaZ